MFCTKCGSELEPGARYCDSCGNVIKSENKTLKEKTHIVPLKEKGSWGAGRIVSLVIFLTVVISGFYGSLDDKSIQKNNEAMESMNNGNSVEAIKKLEESKLNSVSDINTLNTLKNLAYVQDSEGKSDDALNTFKEALVLTKADSFDFYLVNGEIASLENKPEEAIRNFNKAYKLDETNYQINNSLGIFYIDITDSYPQLVDYPKALFYMKRAYEFDAGKLEITKQNLAIAYFYNEDYDTAISMLSSTNLKQHPYAAMWLALSYVGKGDGTNAKLFLQKALDGGAEVSEEVINIINSF